MRLKIGTGVCLCAAFEGAPEEVDITMFEARGTEADAIGRAAADLVAKVRLHGCCWRKSVWKLLQKQIDVHILRRFQIVRQECSCPSRWEKNGVYGVFK